MQCYLKNAWIKAVFVAIVSGWERRPFTTSTCSVSSGSFLNRDAKIREDLDG